MSARRKLKHCTAHVGVHVVSHQDDGTIDLPMRGVHEPGAVRLGEAHAPTTVIPAAAWVPRACGTAHRVPGDQNPKGRRATWHGRRKGARARIGRRGPRAIRTGGA